MSNFSKLSFAQALPAVATDKLAMKRTKLIADLEQQLALHKNPSLTTERDVRNKDEETGETVVTKEQRPVKSWVTVVEGKAYVRVKVGIKSIEFAKGSKFIVTDPKQTKQTLETLIEAATAGELDEHILALFPAK